MGSTNWKKQAEDAAIVIWSDVEELAQATIKAPVVEDDVPEGEWTYSLQEAVNERVRLTTLIAKAERKVKAINDELLVLLNAADKDKVKLWDGMRLERRTGGTPAKIEPTKLLEAGVTLDQIQAATVAGRPYQYIMISKEKGGL